MKKIFVLLLIMFSTFNILSTSAFTKINNLENIVSYTNSEIIRKEILGYGHFSSNNNNMDILNDFLQKNYKDKVFIISESSDSIVATYTCSDYAITINISSSEDSKINKYISIFYSHNLTNENIINLRATIRQMLIDFDKDPKVSSQIVSKINKKLNSIEISSLINSMLSRSSINFNKDYEDSTVSFSGYSKYLEEPISVNGKALNIQASGRYSSSDNSTYIWVGTPIISTEY